MRLALLLLLSLSGCSKQSCFGGEPDCSYRTWAQCRLSQPGVGVYCYMNTLAGYVFDTRDPANPRVIGVKPLRKPQARH